MFQTSPGGIEPLLQVDGVNHGNARALASLHVPGLVQDPLVVVPHRVMSEVGVLLDLLQPPGQLWLLVHQGDAHVAPEVEGEVVPGESLLRHLDGAPVRRAAGSGSPRKPAQEGLGSSTTDAILLVDCLYTMPAFEFSWDCLDQYLAGAVVGVSPASSHQKSPEWTSPCLGRTLRKPDFACSMVMKST